MKASRRYFTEGVFCLFNGKTMRVANLSTGGFFAASDEDLTIGQVMVLELQLPPRESIRVVGEVAWINDPASPVAPNLPKGFGVRFSNIGSGDKETILQVLRRSEPVMGPSRPGEDDRRASS
jgi:Tfp pilus assembly protein PilZ